MITEFTLPLHRFDLNLLPPGARQIGTDEFIQAVALHFATQYASAGQGAIVAVDSDGIKVMTYPIDATPLDMVMPMLQSGRLKEALPYLEALSKDAPNDAAVFYNLGICYSELEQYDEAIIRLKRAVRLLPSYTHAWVGIGTAYYRMQKLEAAVEAFTQALEISPADAYAHRSMGAILCRLGQPTQALPHLRAALADMPDDPRSMLGLAGALRDTAKQDNLVEADALYQRIIREHGNNPAAEMARKDRTAMAHAQLSEGKIGEIRLDVVAYITEALQLFKKIGQMPMQQLALEIAMLGNSGLDINSPEKKYTLKQLPGEFSGLQLLSYMYAAFQLIDPSAELGADFSAEYALALKATK